MKYFFCADGGAVEGPAELDEITEMFRNGRLSKRTQVCEEGQNTWHLLESLFSPKTDNADASPQIPKAIPVPRKILLHTTYKGGLESSMDSLGEVIAALGALGGVAGLGEALMGPGGNGFWIVAAGVSVVQGFTVRALLRCGAEIIRLHKKSNGLPYGGAISKAKGVNSYKCSQCSTSVRGDYCRTCKTTLAI